MQNLFHERTIHRKPTHFSLQVHWESAIHPSSMSQTMDRLPRLEEAEQQHNHIQT